MISNRTLSQINKISGGDFKKSEIKARRKRVIHTDDADTVIQVGDSVLRLTKTHRPVKHAIHSRTNLYKSVRAVWDLASVMDIELSHDDIKGHVDKAITVNILEKALVNSKPREVKKQISELIIALSTADNVKFIKEDINE